MRHDPSKLTPKAEAFAEGFGKHLHTMTEAARQAGYADPNGEVDRLMANPVVVRKVIEHLRSQAVKWQALVAKAKRVLLDAMDSEVMKDGFPVPDTKTRLEAARIALMTMKKDSTLLEDAAADEDAAAESNIDLAKKIIGPPTTIN